MEPQHRDNVLTRLRKLLFSPHMPARYQLLRAIDRRFNVLSYQRKLDYLTVERPFYGVGLLQAALLAKKLGKKTISAIEFGVAGGNGLVALEQHAEAVKAETGVAVTVYGFDTGTGMPPPQDYRDMPYVFQQGYFEMDVPALRARLTSAQLVLGDVAQTLRDFADRDDVAPVGFISFDLDYYSSTVAALKIFDMDHHRLLPRVICYFDDTVGPVDEAYNEFTGELLAIKEFNAASEAMKIAPVNGLRFYGDHIPQWWHEQILVAHLFGHPEYCTPINTHTQLPLASGRPSQSQKRAAAAMQMAEKKV
ncbi:hypothetical protein ABLE91_27410 [Aquabacter sp. CN5-332]|uniref:hypothetical protein n=1 Tax=Aquabacter sp. CN5-332 TaxID=3156608 RepID=UPI0032B55096